MMKRSLHHLTRRLRLVSFAPLAWWAWKYRTDLRRALPLLKAAPRRILAGETGDVVTEAKVLHALATDDRTRGNAAVALCGVHDGVAKLRLTTEATDAAAVVRKVAGVVDVDLDPTTRLNATAYTGLPEPIFA